MTISTTTRSVAYSASGSSAVFAYTFKIIEDSDLKVYQNSTLKTLGAGSGQYGVSGAGSASGGNVTFVTTPSASDKIVIVREVPRTQATDLVENSALPAATLEDALDKLTMIVQEVDDKAGVGFRFADTVTDEGTITIDKNAADRASKVLAFDSAGGLTANQELGEHKGNWAASTAYVLRDIVKDTNNNNQYLCIVAHTSSGAVPISTNTDAAKWRLLVDAASATTSAAAAATSATASATSATASATSATASATSATNSASSASTASTQATNSANSATASASSATSSATSATASASSATASAASATSAASNAGPHYGLSAGSANTYTLTPNPTLTAYAAGVDILVRFHTDNTAASTINVDSLGAKSIKKSDGSTDPDAGDLTGIVELVYDGTVFRMVGGSASTDTQTNINAADIFLLNSRRLSDHSANVLNYVDGAVDTFTDGSTQNNTMLNLSSPTTGVTHDNTNKYWENTRGAAANSDKDYTTAEESQYVQQVWNKTNTSTGNATFTNGSANVTLASGSWFATANSMRISPSGDGSNWYDISSGQGTGTLVLATTFGQSTVTSDYMIRGSEFYSDEVRLNAVTSSTADTVKDSYGTGTPTADWNFARNSDTERALGVCFQAQSSYSLGSCLLWLKKVGSPTGNVTCTLYASSASNDNGLPTGSALATSTSQDGSTFSTSTTETTFVFPSGQNYSIVASTWYCMTITTDNQNDSSNRWQILGDNSTSDANVSVFADAGTGGGSGGYNWATRSYDMHFKTKTFGSANAEDTYISVCDAEANKTNTTTWADVNSAARTETLNSQNAFYWVSFDPAASFGAGTEVKIFNQTGSVWRRIAYNDSGTWKYNNNASHNATWTEATATVNDFLFSVSQAVSSQAANRMTGAELAAITDGEWVATNGFATSQTGLIRGVTLHSTSNAQNPSVSQYRINYDADNSAGVWQTRAFGGTNMPPVPASAPSNLVIEIIEKRVSGTPVYYLSRDGGSNWQTVSSWDIEDTLADGTICRLSDVTMTATSGTSPMFKMTCASGEDIRLYSLGLKYK